MVSLSFDGPRTESSVPLPADSQAGILSTATPAKRKRGKIGRRIAEESRALRGSGSSSWHEFLNFFQQNFNRSTLRYYRPDAHGTPVMLQHHVGKRTEKYYRNVVLQHLQSRMETSQTANSNSDSRCVRTRRRTSGLSSTIKMCFVGLFITLS